MPRYSTPATCSGDGRLPDKAHAQGRCHRSGHPRAYPVPLQGFLYLVVIMDWLSRAVLAWRLSNTLDADFCVEALEEALSRYGRPEIFSKRPWRLSVLACAREAPSVCFEH